MIKFFVNVIYLDKYGAQKSFVNNIFVHVFWILNPLEAIPFNPIKMYLHKLIMNLNNTEFIRKKITLSLFFEDMLGYQNILTV